MRAIRIGDTFLFPSGVVSVRRATKPVWGGRPAEEGVSVTTLAGATLEFAGPGIWEAFRDWASGCDGPVDATPAAPP